jgi:Flp pilus assembly protein TadD
MQDAHAMEIPEQLAQRLERCGSEFLAEFLGLELQRHPENLEALAERAEVLTRLGRLEEGRAHDRRLCELVPGDPTAHYNLACSLALLGHLEDALSELELAVELGYDDPAHLARDEDLVRLRGMQRFLDLIARLNA